MIIDLVNLEILWIYAVPVLLSLSRGLYSTPSATTLASTTCFHEKALSCQDRLGGQKSGTG